MTLDAPDERPLDRSGAPLVGEDGKPRGLTNVEALEKARKFLSYAKTNGQTVRLQVSLVEIT